MRYAVVVIALAGCGRLNYDDMARRDGEVIADVPGFSLDASVFPDGVAAAPCGTSVLLADGFDDGVPGPLFAAFTDADLTLSEPAGVWRIDFAPVVAPGKYAGYHSTSLYAPEGLCATIEVLAVPSGDGTLFMKLGSASQQIEFFEYGGTLELRTHMGNAVAVLARLAFDPAQHRFWRLRQQGGITHWDTSPDDVQYVTHVSTTFVTASELEYVIGGGAYRSVSNAGFGSIDNASLRRP